MAGITLAQAETGLSNAIAAMEKAVNSASYGKSGGQINASVTHQPLDKLQANVDWWENRVQKLLNSQNGIILSQVSPQ